MAISLEQKSLRRPRIAILTNYPFDGKSFSGGVETATAGLLEGLQCYSDEFDFRVLALASDIEENINEKRLGITFHFMAVPGRWHVRPHVIPNILNARAELKKLHADIVHCQDNMALALGAMSIQGSKKLFTVHGIKSVESRVWKGPEYWSHLMDGLLERWVRQHFEDVITISPYVDRFLPIHVRKHHVTNPVRAMFFENPQSGNASRDILFVGVLTRLKRPLDLIQAFRVVKNQFPDAGLKIVGQPEDNRYREEMKKYISDARLDGVSFLGVRAQDEVAALMRTCGVLVLPSLQENTPMAIAEAMASGLPVIASNVGGISAMVQDNADGLLYECGNVDQLAHKITAVLSDGDLRKKLSLNGRKKAIEKFSSASVAAATVDIYRKTMGTA